LLLFFLHHTNTSEHQDRHQSVYPHKTNTSKHPQTKTIHTTTNMFFFGSSRTSKQAEAVQTPRASTSSERATPTPAQQQARKQVKKLSVAEDYWTNPALWPIGAPKRH
jgi:hypothetical protein